jgi:hypothetical protein
VPQIGLHGMDLAYAAKRLEEVCKLGAAYGNSDPIVALGQGAHYVPAKKTGAAIDSN